MFEKNGPTLRKKKTWCKKSKGQEGQSLVEIAIAAPLLILMFIGVFEVGWALRGYIVLANVNRESVRFAVKQGTLDYSVKNPATVGYDKVLSHTTVSLSRQLPLEFLDPEPNATVIMSHLAVDTGYPCVKYQGGKPKVPYEFDENCDCTVDDLNDPQWFTRDDLVLHPDVPGFAYYAQTYGISQTTRIGRGSYQAEADKLILDNNQLNCTVLKTGSAGEMSVNNMFIAETFFDQPQLFGVPFISNRLTDPIPFYTHTAMRIVDTREANKSDTIGPACQLYPIIFPEQDLWDPDDDGVDEYSPGNPPEGITIDAFEGGGSGGFGWLNWSPGDNSDGYIVEELHNPRLSMHDFTGLFPPPNLNPDSANTGLNIGDWVSGSTGVNTSSGVQRELEDLSAGMSILIPIYDTTAGSGANRGYHISHIARIKITHVCLPNNQCGQDMGLNGNDKVIFAVFERLEDEACMG
jgi:hypothetical protein